MKKIIISCHRTNTRVCIVEDGKLVEFWVEKDSIEKLVGNIYKGKVTNVIKGMNSAFVNFGLEKNGFLYADDTLDIDEISNIDNHKLNVKVGDEIMVQVVKEQFGTKGARLSMNISLAGRGLILMPNSDVVCASKKILDDNVKNELIEYISSIKKPGYGFILRTQSTSCSKDELKEELEELEKKWKIIKNNFSKTSSPSLIYKEESLAIRSVRDMLREDVEEIIVDNKKMYDELIDNFPFVVKNNPNLFKLYTSTQDILYAYQLTSQIDKLLDRKVELKNGANLVIDRTEALTVIDVNTGKYIGQKELSETLFETNLIAAKEIARQIRLRNLGGIIIVDFIDMENPKYIDAVMETLRGELAKDRVKTSAIDMTPLGLVEITRKKMRSMLDDVMLQTCPYCGGNSYVFSDEHVAYKMKEDLNVLFKNPKNKSIVINLSTSVFNKIFAYKLFEKECLNQWADKRIYLVPDEKLHIEKYIIKCIDSAILDLPDNARLLY